MFIVALLELLLAFKLSRQIEELHLGWCSETLLVELYWPDVSMRGTCSRVDKTMNNTGVIKFTTYITNTYLRQIIDSDNDIICFDRFE